MTQQEWTPQECSGHPCEDDPERFPNAGIGDLFYCDGSCQPEFEGEEVLYYDPKSTNTSGVGWPD